MCVKQVAVLLIVIVNFVFAVSFIPLCPVRGCKNRPLSFLAGCRKERLNQALSVLSLSLGFL